VLETGSLREREGGTRIVGGERDAVGAEQLCKCDVILGEDLRRRVVRLDRAHIGAVPLRLWHEREIGPDRDVALCKRRVRGGHLRWYGLHLREVFAQVFQACPELFDGCGLSRVAAVLDLVRKHLRFIWILLLEALYE